MDNKKTIMQTTFYLPYNSARRAGLGCDEGKGPELAFNRR